MEQNTDNTLFALISDIRERQREQITDLKELRKEFHQVNLKLASMSDTYIKIVNLEDKIANVIIKVENNEERLRLAELRLAVNENDTEHHAGQVGGLQINHNTLQREHNIGFGKIAGIGAAILAFIALGGLLNGLLM